MSPDYRRCPRCGGSVAVVNRDGVAVLGEHHTTLQAFAASLLVGVFGLSLGPAKPCAGSGSPADGLAPGEPPPDGFSNPPPFGGW